MDGSKDMLLAFYGDDFTGSTDALEFLSRAGAKTILFLENPSVEQLSRYENLDAIGIAGMTRAMGPDQMMKTLRPAFEALKQLNPRHIHYKVCSTFDSSPEIGNIGTAIETGNEILPNDFTPVLVASPNLGRYSAFGHLYARMGIGSEGAIYRLDRHPSMSRHPVTPAEESDLRLHLSGQTTLSTGLIDLTDLEKTIEEIEQKLQAEIASGKKVIFFDAMYEHQMVSIGQVLDGQVKTESPLFSVGSSGVEKALGDYWASNGKLVQRTVWEELSESGPMLVLSGSCSPVTANQISWALDQGFEEVTVSITSLEQNDLEAQIGHYASEISSLLQAGKSVILHTCKGPEDTRVNKTKKLFEDGASGHWMTRMKITETFGRVLGESARKALSVQPVQRLVIAGGDTSSYVARVLGIEAVEMIAPVFTGAPMCRAYAPGSPVDQIEVNLKGGQVGDETYFEAIRQGKVKITASETTPERQKI